MNNKQRAKLDSYNRTTDFNMKYSSDISAIPDYSSEQAKFDSAVSAIKVSGGVQQLPTGSDAEAADLAKSTMAKTVEKYCLRAAVKARINGDIVLGRELEYSAADIYHANKSSALQISINLRNLINDNLATLTTINASDVADLDNAIAAYDLIKDAPTEAKQSKKAGGTDPLPALFAQADAAIINMADLITGYLGDQYPNIVTEFMLAKQAISTGSRSTSISFTLLADENGSAIIDGQTTDDETGKAYAADETGIVHIKNHRAGHFHFIVTAPGRIDLDFACDVKQGMSNDFTVRLKK